MKRRSEVAAALSMLALTGCGSSSTVDASVKEDFQHGISEIRGTHDSKKLRARVVQTLRTLRQDRARTAAGRRARALAVQGFAWTLKGIESRIDFVENDSGNIEAATRDAARADRALKRGASLLRAAGRVLGVHVPSLNGY
jgi:hypothetical protein